MYSNPRKLERRKTSFAEASPPLGVRTSAIGQVGKPGEAFSGMFGVTNPNALLHRLQPKQSLSGAMDYYSLQDQWYWDSLDEMTQKSITIGAVLDLVVDQTLRRSASIKLDSEATPEASALRDRIEENILPMANDICRFLAVGGLQHGISIGENVFEREADGFLGLKECTHTHPGLYAFNDRRELCMWSASEWYKTGQPLPDWKFPLLRRFALYGNPWGDSLVGKLVVPYFGEMKTSERMLQLIDRYGIPLAVATMKSGGGNPDAMQEVREAQARLNTALEAIAAGAAGVVLDPWTEKLEWKDKSFAGSAVPHFTALAYYKKEIVMRFLGATLGVMEAEFGTRAQAEVHASIGDLKTKPMAMQLCETITNGIIQPLVDFNWTGPGEKPVIRFDIDTRDPINLDEAIKRLEAAKANPELGYTVKQAQDELNIAPATGDEKIIGGTEDGGAVGELYAYDLQYGVATINDARAKKGLPPMEGGDRTYPEIYGTGVPGGAVGIGMDETDGTMEVSDADAESMDFITVKEAAQLRGGKSNGVLPWIKTQAPKNGLTVRVSRGRVHRGDFEKLWQAGIRTIGGPPTDPKEPPPTPPSGGVAHAPAPEEPTPFDDGALLAPPRSFAEAQPNLTAKERRELDKANRKARARVERNYLDRMYKLSGYLVTDSRDAARGAAKAALDKAKPGKDLKIKFDAPEAVQTGLLASSLLALAAGGAQYGELVPKVFAEEELDPRFESAVQWMRDRGILTTAELEAFTASLNASLAVSEETITPAIVERTVRQQFLALKKSTSDVMTAKINESLQSSINTGGTFQDWISDQRAAIDAGEISAVSDGYLENVYRTETANAYTAQQSALESSPAIDNALLGWTVMNPDDSRSRESHARLNGLFFPKNHPATKALGRPPFSYQCRCVFVPEIGTAAMAPEVNPNLSEIAGRVEKFGECCHHDAN